MAPPRPVGRVTQVRASIPLTLHPRPLPPRLRLSVGLPSFGTRGFWNHLTPRWEAPSPLPSSAARPVLLPAGRSFRHLHSPNLPFSCLRTCGFRLPLVRPHPHLGCDPLSSAPPQPLLRSNDPRLLAWVALGPHSVDSGWPMGLPCRYHPEIHCRLHPPPR